MMCEIAAPVAPTEGVTRGVTCYRCPKWQVCSMGKAQARRMTQREREGLAQRPSTGEWRGARPARGACSGLAEGGAWNPGRRTPSCALITVVIRSTMQRCKKKKQKEKNSAL